jgi:hypothetical protein
VGAELVHLVSGLPLPRAAGAAGSFTVTAKDAYGNVVPTFSGAVQLLDEVGDLVTLLASYSFTAADHGVHTFSGLALNSLGQQTLQLFDVAQQAFLASMTIDVVSQV